MDLIKGGRIGDHRCMIMLMSVSDKEYFSFHWMDC
jgi:hypothetical protein